MGIYLFSVLSQKRKTTIKFFQQVEGLVMKNISNKQKPFQLMCIYLLRIIAGRCCKFFHAKLCAFYQQFMTHMIRTKLNINPHLFLCFSSVKNKNQEHIRQIRGLYNENCFFVLYFRGIPNSIESLIGFFLNVVPVCIMS